MYKQDYIFYPKSCQKESYEDLKDRCEQLQSELQVANKELNKIKADLDWWFNMLNNPKLGEI